jgi:hypothetical protein
LVVEKLANSLGLGAGSQIKTVEGVRWPTVRLLSKKEKALADLQQNNPEMYDEVTGNLEKVEQAQETVKKEIIDAGLVPTTVLVDGVPVPAGEDYATGEKTVHTPDGRVLPEKEFRREVGEKKRQQAHLMSSFATMPMLRPENLQLSGVRKLSDEDLLNPDVIPLQPNGAPQAIVYRALTDDKAAQNKNTRIYPTMLDKDGDPIIVDGRFKGFKLDDMVNAVGRLVEGAAYDLDANGYPVAFETTNADGMLEITANKEPYCTLDSQGRFLIRIPVIPSGRGKKDPYTIARRNMERVSSKKAVIDPKTKEEVKKGRTKGTSILELPVPEGGTPLTLFSFEAKDFATVRTAVGGMVLSASAAKKIREYYSQMARQEEATKKENLKPYSLDRIGGFKSQQVIDPATGEPYDPPVLTKDLQSKQKEALSWIEAKGYKGLAALDTGVGKTLLSIATMQKMVRDGAAPEGSRFLYVCPKKLKGNFPRELQAWMTEEAAQGLRSRVDIMSYEEFTFKVVGGIRTKKMAVPGTENLEKVLGEDGKPLRGPDGKIVYRPVPGTEKMVSMKTPDGKPIKEKVLPSPDFARQYAAIFFDEAQVLVKNENSAVSRAAQTLNHPRKVLLTASPMEDDPDELYVGVAITNNVVVASTGRGKLSQERKDLMAFRRRFCVRVAGRTVGIKSDSDKDPTARQDFDAWAKSGMYFADKRTVGTDEGVSDYEKGLKLTTLHKQALSLTMDPEVELEYKAAAKGVMKVLKGLVSVYRDKTLPPAAVRAQVESFQKALKDYMGTLNALANYPDEVVDPKTGKKKFPGAVSSKVAGATWLVSEKITNGKRTLLFTDDPKFAVKTVEQMSANLPNMRVAVALSDKVVIYVNGKPQEGKENVFTQRQYKYTDENGKTAIVPKDEWASYVLRSIIGGDPTVKALVLTKSYALGQNLQMFSTVVHLDRDTFSNETMKQRTARAWRTGQKDPVEEYTMDAVFDAKTETSDPTLDEVRKYIQESQENVFNEIVHKSKEAIIGQEWKGMQDTPASMVAVNRKLFELALGPYPAALGDEDYDRSVQNQ